MAILTSIATLSSPFGIAGLVPIFAAGLVFLRYVAVDPETFPPNAKEVSTNLKVLSATVKKKYYFFDTTKNARNRFKNPLFSSTVIHVRILVVPVHQDSQKNN